MSTLTFDTLKFANRLKDAGFAPVLAEAQAAALAEAFATNTADFATKADWRETKAELQGSIHELRLEMEGKFRLLQWMLGFVGSGVVALVLKAFV